MALEVDTSRALRSRGQIEALIRAVLAADEEDETDWIEWKTILDFSKKSAFVMMAKEIIGLANRLPARASNYCEGVGYLVVGGAANNDLRGVEKLDPAILQQKLEPYLGSGDGAPVFSPTYHEVDGKQVLVVTVEARHPGDLFYSLNKESQLDGGARYREGTVFVRKGTSTNQASQADLVALQRNLLAGQVAELDVLVRATGDVPLSWLDPVAVRSLIEKRVRAEGEAMIAKARRLEEGRRRPRSSSIPDVLMRDLAYTTAIAVLTDRRSLAEYIGEVEAWVEEKIKAGLCYFDHVCGNAGIGRVCFEVENAGKRFLEGAKLEVDIDLPSVTLRSDPPKKPDLPQAPRPYGDTSWRYNGRLAWPISSGRAGLVIPNPRVEIAGGMATLDLGDLRPQGGTQRSDPLYVMLDFEDRPSELRVSWTASAKRVDKVATGEVVLPVAGAASDPAAVLEKAVARVA